MSGHSPGPWREDGHHVRDANGELVVADGGEGGFAAYGREAADRRLIAAAPELLKLVRRLAEAPTYCGEVINPDVVGMSEEDQKEALALVARIDGTAS